MNALLKKASARLRWGLVSALVTGGTALVGCGGDETDDGETLPPRWLDDVDQELPEKLSDVGVYEDLGALSPYSDVMLYEPLHALYSNGLDKQRLLHLPEGATIDGDGEQAYVFPDGTLLAKTFSWNDEPVETRLLIKRADGWDYALYAWDDEGDATWAGANWVEETLALDGVEHTLPARLDCRTCHETAEKSVGTAVLGISPLQADDVLADSDAFAAPPTRGSLDASSDDEAKAFGYFIGNCISCHNGGKDTNSSFSLYPQDVLAETVDQPTESETGEGIRVVPGDADQSVLFETVVKASQPDYTGPFKAMPPLGINVPDPAAEGILRPWIEGLEDE